MQSAGSRRDGNCLHIILLIRLTAYKLCMQILADFKSNRLGRHMHATTFVNFVIQESTDGYRCCYSDIT